MKTTGDSAKRTEVLGLNFHSVTLSEALTFGASWLKEEGFALVVTPNPEFILMAQKDEQFKTVLNSASLMVPDGIGVIFASRILKRPLPTRVPGIDFAWGMLEELNKEKGRLFLLGAKDGVAQVAGEELKKKFPDVTICGCHHGYFKEEQDPEVVAKIAETKPDLIFVCLGAPRQEEFLARWGDEIGAKMGIGLGGAIDVFAGNVERAPVFWQKMNLEWFYRLCKEPKRIGRMAKLPLVLVQAWNQRLFRKKY